MKIRTTDLCDRYATDLQIAEPIFKDYGGKLDFAGPIVTGKVYEDNVIVRKILEEPGSGRVLVVDGGGSLRRAIIGGIIADLACKNGWAGVLINGCIRDIGELAQISIGVKALNVIPLRPLKEGKGQRDIAVAFAGMTFTPGHYLYADEDGVVVSARKLEMN
jgi:regulator of ribonuclease activity A